MNKLTALVLCALTFTFAQPAQALTADQQDRALREILEARVEIQATLRLVPRALRSVGDGLENADRRLESAERILRRAETSQEWYCTIRSTFDGDFAGEGRTRLEASSNAQQNCQRNSRNGGFFCKADSIKCARNR